MTGPDAAEDNKTLVLAFYVVVDVSLSMKDILTDVRDLLGKVADAIDANPMLADLVRFGAMDFSDDARVVLRLGDLRDERHLPTFTARGSTSFAAAFRLLRHELAKDLAHLRGDNFRVHRPAVFFITDGVPTDERDDLQAAFDELTSRSFKERPNILMFGVGGDATKESLDQWVYPKTGKAMRSYLARDGVSPSTAINGIAELLVASIVASAHSVADLGDGGGFIPPDDEDLDDWI